jgi:collectin sub-family protein 10
MLKGMVRRVAWLGFLTSLVGACTDDFSTFDPDAAAPPNVGSAAEATVEAGQDAQPVDSGKDVTVQDSPADIGPADVTPDVVACTETGAITYNGHCYFLVATTQNQAAASTNCKNTGAHLVTITTSGEQATVIALGSGTERWTDLVHNGVPVKDQNYSWATGESRNGYNAWSPGEPNGTGQCATLLAATGLWNDQDCTLSLASICERE